jgi:hypothetical protein
VLNRDEEQRLAAIIGTINAEKEGKQLADLTLETTSWLAEKLKEVNDELKVQFTECNGNERHRHYNLDEGTYSVHRHPHERRRMDFNNLHHHPPVDHRKS